MRDLTHDNFGLVIAYVLPGFVALWGVRSVVPEVDLLLGTPAGAAPSVGGFLYGTVGATAAGLIVSTVRWAVLDRLYHRTGIPEPAWEFRHLPATLAAFESHVQDHYRYYQFYSYMLVAILVGSTLHLLGGGTWLGANGWGTALIALLLVVLVLGSRDALRKYYARTGVLLAPRPTALRIKKT